MESSAALATKKNSIFIVDDNAFVRQGLRSFFDSYPDLSICGEADTIQAALDKISFSEPDIAIIDLSLNGKETDGIELIRKLRGKNLKFPILAHSYHNETPFIQSAISAGAQGYVLKLDARKNLIKAIRQVLAGKTYMSDSLANINLQR